MPLWLPIPRRSLSTPALQPFSSLPRGLLCHSLLNQNPPSAVLEAEGPWTRQSNSLGARTPEGKNLHFTGLPWGLITGCPQAALSLLPNGPLRAATCPLTVLACTLQSVPTSPARCAPPPAQMLFFHLQAQGHPASSPPPGSLP